MLTNGGPPAQRSLAWRSHFLPASKDQLFACKEVSFYIVNLEVDSERKKNYGCKWFANYNIRTSVTNYVTSMTSQEEHFLSPTWLQHQPAIFSLAFWYVLFHCLIPFIFDFTSQLYEQRDDNVIILVSFIFRDWSSLAQFYSRNCCCWNPYKNWKRFLY